MHHIAAPGSSIVTGAGSAARHRPARSVFVNLGGNSDTPSSAARMFWFWLVGATLLAGGLRLYHLSEASFWVDELNTVRVCADLPGMHRSKVFGYIPTAVAMWCNGADPVILANDMAEEWMAMGVTEFSARIASCLIGILCIPVLGIASRRVLGTRESQLLMLLLAIAPWHIYWSQAARFYTQEFLFYNLTLLWYFTATESGSKARFAAAMVALVLSYLSQPPALVIVSVFALDWIVALLRRKPVRLGVFGWTIAVVALLTCVGTWFRDYQHKPEQWDKFAGDLYQSPMNMILGTTFMTGPAVVLFAAIAGWRQLQDRTRRSIYLVIAAVVPVLFFTLLSLRSYVGLRYTFIALFAALALVAVGLEEVYRVLKPKVGRLVAAAPLGILCTSMMLFNYGYYTSGKGFHTRWRDAFAYIADHRQPGDYVACNHPMIGKYYLQDEHVRNMPKSVEDLAEFDKPLWIAIETEDAIRGRVVRWLDEAVDWMEHFDVRVVQPYSSVRVYRYDPDHP
jgi:hypothetical protein